MDRALYLRPAQRLCPLAALLTAGLHAQAPPQPGPPAPPSQQQPPQGPPGSQSLPPQPGPPPGTVPPGLPGQATQGPPDLQSKTYSFAAEDHPIPVDKVPGQIRVFVLDDIQ